MTTPSLFPEFNEDKFWTNLHQAFAGLPLLPGQVSDAHVQSIVHHTVIQAWAHFRPCQNSMFLSKPVRNRAANTISLDVEIGILGVKTQCQVTLCWQRSLFDEDDDLFG